MPSLLEAVLIGALALLLVRWWAPGLQAAVTLSREATHDWAAVLWPLAGVTLFVIALIMFN